MDIFDVNKSLIENLSFFSGPVVALLGLFVILQLRLTKKQFLESQRHLKINSQRNAAIISAEQVKIYCELIIPMQNKLFVERKKSSFPNFNGEIKNFTNDEFETWDKDYKEAFLNKPDDIARLELEMLNQMEAFSIYFIQKIAEEKIAFSSIGTNFCRTIESYYPIISFMRGSKNPNKNYQNIVELYKVWKNRINHIKYKEEEEELSKELQDKFEKLEKLRLSQNNIIQEIKPIGT